MLKNTSGSCAHRFGAISRGVGADRRVEGVGQAVRDVGRDHERAYAALGAEHGRSRGHARLADAALARVEQDPGQDRPPVGMAIVAFPSRVPAWRDSSRTPSAISTTTAPVTLTRVVSPQVTRQSAAAAIEVWPCSQSVRREAPAQPLVGGKAAVVVILGSVAEAARRNVAHDDQRPLHVAAGARSTWPGARRPDSSRIACGSRSLARPRQTRRVDTPRQLSHRPAIDSGRTSLVACPVRCRDRGCRGRRAAAR